MNVDISGIAKSINKEMECTVELSMDVFHSKMGDFPITRKEPVELRIRNQENAALLIEGIVDVEVMIPCDRCLEDVKTPIHFNIEKKLLMKEAEDAKVEGVSFDDEMEEPDYLIGFELDVEKLVYTEILVNWPMKVLCKDDCEGICKVCGMNLNKGACSCQKTELDPRMAAIQDIFNKFKEV